VRPAERIAAAVTSWEGVSAGPHRFGGVEFKLGRRELGHLHGDRLADLPFPKRERDRLIAEGRAREHRWVPDSGWLSVDIRDDSDVEAVIGLFRQAYERASRARSVRPAESSE